VLNIGSGESSSWGGSVQELADACGEPGAVAELAFPEDEDVPALATEGAGGAEVAGAVALELGEPVGAAGVGDAAAAAPPPGVHVPEAAVDVDDFFEAGEDEVGGAGEGCHDDDSAANFRRGLATVRTFIQSVPGDERVRQSLVSVMSRRRQLRQDSQEKTVKRSIPMQSHEGTV